MKKITTIINPFKLDDVREAITSLGILGMTITEVKGFGRQKGHTETYRGAEYAIDFVPKVQVDIILRDTQVEPAVQAIRHAATTDKVGAGKIFVSPIEHVTRIRTGETDDDAL